jgi:HSP20 family protein
MKLTKPNYSPVKDVFQDFFNTAINRTLSDYLNVDAPITQPSVNITETADEYKIQLAAPGMQKKDFNIALENDRLTISAEKEESKEDNSENYTRKEFSYSSFSRSFELPDTVHAEKVEASYENGILNISLPKKPEAKPQPAKKIEIQ